MQRHWIIAGVSVVAILAVVRVGVARAFRPEPTRASTAVADATCISCHREKQSFEQTAHRLTARPVTRAAIAGSFDDGANVLRTANPRLHYRMDSAATGFYETAVEQRGRDSSTHTERIDIVTGIRKGESYLSWRGDRLYQMPVSYWKGVGWINSPGYRDGVVNFDRPILPRCLECHAPGFEPVGQTGADNRYRRTNPDVGIGCEACHGAGRTHVLRERSVLRALPTSIIPSGIVNPARLPRARQLDGCALCHAGIGTLRTPAFSYVPGTPLAKHLAIPMPTLQQQIDVHGNQLELLERSRCFVSSGMTCITCHDVHGQQRDLASLSNRCVTCHTPAQVASAPRHRGQTVAGRCVECHMPNLTSNVIASSMGGREERPQVRSHWIRVYPEMVGR